MSSQRQRQPELRQGTRRLTDVADDGDTDAVSEEQQYQEQGVCPECDSTHVTDDGSETVCGDCGLVITDQTIDRGPEWRSFDDGENGTNARRTGAPVTEMLHDKGLTTQISWQNKDANGQTLSARKRKRMGRLRKWQERCRTSDSKERNVKHAITEIDRMASALGLPENIRETASVIYQKAVEEDLLIGRSIEGMTTASLYAAARQGNVPRTFDEFAPVSKVDALEVKRAYRHLNQNLGLNIQPARPEEYLPRLCSELDVDDEVKRRTRDILSDTEGEAWRSGKNPIGLAAAAIYAAGVIECPKEYTQSDIGEAADISDVTIRNRYRQFLESYSDHNTDSRMPAGVQRQSGVTADSD